MSSKYQSALNPALLAMLILVAFVGIIASIAYTVKHYINSFKNPKITPNQKVVLWLSITFNIILYSGLIYLGIQYGIFARIYALVTGDVE